MIFHQLEEKKGQLYLLFEASAKIKDLFDICIFLHLLCAVILKKKGNQLGTFLTNVGSSIGLLFYSNYNDKKI